MSDDRKASMKSRFIAQRCDRRSTDRIGVQLRDAFRVDLTTTMPRDMLILLRKFGD